MARKRERWKAHQGRLDASRLVFIDETWVKTNMAPLRNWGPRGLRTGVQRESDSLLVECSGLLMLFSRRK